MDTAATPSHIASPGVAYTPLDLAFCAVGRPIETRRAEWMAAVLTCGSGAALSDQSGGALWDITEEGDGVIHVTVRPHRDIRQPSLVAHRRWTLDPADVTVQDGIPVTTPLRTLIDLATEIPRDELEAAINEADKLDLIDPESLRRALDERRGQRGMGVLRRVLDLRSFRLTDSQLERRFLALARRAGLPTPLTQQRVNGFRVDFYWPRLRLVVETDGLRYHRTPEQQAKDRLATKRTPRPALHRSASHTARFASSRSV